MIIAVAGPYSTDTEEYRTANPDGVNIAATEVYRKGHVPEIPNHNK